MLYEPIFRGLHTARVRYLIARAVAINLHGVPRITADLDLMVDLGEDNLRTFLDVMAGLAYRPRAPVRPEALLDPAIRREWREARSMVMFSWVHPQRPYEEIDVFLENPIEFEGAHARRRDLPLGDIVIPLTSIEDLIAMKRLAGREQDRSDVEALTQLLRLRKQGQA